MGGASGMIVRRIAFGCVWVFASVGWAQSPKPMPKGAQPVYEVVTIKPSDPADRSQGFRTRGRRFVVRNESVISIIMFAYGVHKKQIADGPAWMDDRFDVDGVPDIEGEPSLAQMQHILKSYWLTVSNSSSGARLATCPSTLCVRSRVR